jgi:hypothetical protein
LRHADGERPDGGVLGRRRRLREWGWREAGCGDRQCRSTGVVLMAISRFGSLRRCARLDDGTSDTRRTRRRPSPSRVGRRVKPYGAHPLVSGSAGPTATSWPTCRARSPYTGTVVSAIRS